MNKAHPFQTPAVLKATQLPLPDREYTPAMLPALNLAEPMLVEPVLEGYQTLYGLNKIDALHWQGYLNLAQHKTHVQVFIPRQQAQGTVWLLHGYLEHSGIYQPIIEEIIEQGFSVITYDLPGHGLTEGPIASIQEFSIYQNLLDELRHWAETQLKQLPKPWLGIGQSTGGAIWIDHTLTAASQRRAPMIDRALLLSPLVRPAQSAWWHNSIGLSLIKRVKRNVPRTFRRNNHNPEFLRFVRLADPLQPRVMSLEWILALAKWMVRIEQLPACRIPVWVAQGAKDQTVNWRYNLEFIRKKFRLQTLLILEEGSHQLINERSDIRAALTGLIPAFLHANDIKRYYYDTE
ncbi:alpha/beta hydrolase [Alkanindiges sp. WGS2144]|uniref:alpha/beta hydrolase n=1 Tax=Alkanindiges sp. WGS2144 TaxID=3366808 RepID=UPI00375196FE